MEDLKKFKKPIIIIAVVILVLMLMIAIGFTLGILSDDPDGLERLLIDYKGESWFENLPSAWNPILRGIESEYLAGIIGIVITVLFMMAVFYFFVYLGKKKK